MADTYPYVISNNRLPVFFEKTKTAAKPPKLTNELLKQLGFASSNDRAIIPLLKKLGFLKEDGSPTEYYDRLKDTADHPFVMGERIRELYKDLFAVNTEIQKASDPDIKSAFARITGKDDTVVNRYFTTFKTLVGLAKFGESPRLQDKAVIPVEESIVNEKISIKGSKLASTFHYNIQIHLPATTDVSVYNAIFRSVRENLSEPE